MPSGRTGRPTGGSETAGAGVSAGDGGRADRREGSRRVGPTGGRKTGGSAAALRSLSPVNHLFPFLQLPLPPPCRDHRSRRQVHAAGRDVGQVAVDLLVRGEAGFDELGADLADGGGFEGGAGR